MKIIDFHCDTIFKLIEDKEKLELMKNPFSIDIEKLKKGKSMAQFFALYVDLKEKKDPLENCLEMLDKFYIELSKNKEDIRIARNYEELMKNHRNGKISAFLTIEEGGVLKGQIHHVRNFYRLGVRLITLTWNYPNEIGYPNVLEDTRSKGLTSFGEELIDEMNHLGILVDVSHLSDQGFYDVARLSKNPFVASHSNARYIKNHPRNLKDDMIKILASKGGIIGINFAKEFLGDEPISKIDNMIHHMKHIRNIGGIDVLAIGSDFDGIDSNLEIENIGQIYKLIEALEKEGFSLDEIEKICYKNSIRIIKDVLK